MGTEAEGDGIGIGGRAGDQDGLPSFGKVIPTEVDEQGRPLARDRPSRAAAMSGTCPCPLSP